MPNAQAYLSNTQKKMLEKQSLKLKNIMSQNPENLKKMVIVSENMQQKTSKLILNQNAKKFKENIEVEIKKIQS